MGVYTDGVIRSWRDLSEFMLESTSIYTGTFSKTSVVEVCPCSSPNNLGTIGLLFFTF